MKGMWRRFMVATAAVVLGLLTLTTARWREEEEPPVQGTPLIREGPAWQVQRPTISDWSLRHLEKWGWVYQRGGEQVEAGLGDWLEPAIPAVGLGTYLAKGDDVRKAVAYALKIGYRHIDTAVSYGNHAEIAKGIYDSGVPRSEIWITSKIPYTMQGRDEATKAINQMLSELNTHYIDLVLTHFPGVASSMRPELGTITVMDDPAKQSPSEIIADPEVSYDYRRGTWQAMEEAQRAGKVKYLGVSNFLVKHLRELWAYATELPIVNQLEVHPYNPRVATRQWCDNHGILIEAYGSIKQNGHLDLLKDPLFKHFASGYQKSSSQAALRWAIDQDMVVLPKSVTPGRIKSNFKLWGFHIGRGDHLKVDKMECIDRKGGRPWRLREEHHIDYAPGHEKYDHTCRRVTPCGKIADTEGDWGVDCYPGTYYWDPHKVPVAMHHDEL